MNRFMKAMGNGNMTYTENGALTHKSSNSAIVDFFFHGAALRTEKDEHRIINLFADAFKEDPTTALRILFYIRDIRGGQGERRIFRIMLSYLVLNHPDWLIKNMKLIPEYGRWDDLFILRNTSLEAHMIDFIKKQLMEDLDNYSQGKSVSLLAKWLPSENTSSIKTRTVAKYMRINLGYTPRAYRKVLSTLRNAIDVVERKLSAKQVDLIQYAHVPSNASLKYKKAFMKHDEERYKAYLDSVSKGETKINAATLYPYDLVHKAMFEYDNTVEALWKNLPDYVEDLCGLVVADTSGSMYGRPMEVSISLAMYIAERNKNEAWKDYFISFSRVPKFHKVQGKTLIERMRSVKLGHIENTDLQAVFNMILTRAIQHSVPQEDMPKILLIVSDMEFDRCCVHNSLTNFETIRNKYESAGYEMPTVVFWNVNSRNTQSPITIDERGAVLIGGCSPVVLKYALGSCTSPLQMVYNVTESNRYKNIVFE